MHEVQPSVAGISALRKGYLVNLVYIVVHLELPLYFLRFIFFSPHAYTFLLNPLLTYLQLRADLIDIAADRKSVV